MVLDSLTGYFNAMAQEGMLVEQMHDLLSYLSRQGVLTILVITQEGLASVGTSNTVDISYLSDTIVVLRQFEAEGAIRRCIAAIKKRQGEHETTIRELMINPGGVSIGEPLSRFSNVLNGSVRSQGGASGRGGQSGRDLVATLNHAGPNAERILVFAPLGRDTEVLSRLLEEHGLSR